MGKVYLIGAGPGDVGLFTLKGNKILQKADVVVYDALVSDSILALIPKTAKLINVGKRASHHTMAQGDINNVLLEKSKTNNIVVRLKGGDPFLFGRGGEELELLAQNGTEFEVVPGVTSSIAVPAYNGIPVTHRDYCSSLHIITGHKKAGKNYDIDFEALVKTKGTLVFLMGVSALKDICDNLIANGMDKTMPAAILQQGTTSKQKRIVATVATLYEETQKQGIETPAIIVVGKVCNLASKFEWYEKNKLFRHKFLVPRPKNLSSKLSAKLSDLGAEVLEIPTIETIATNDNIVNETIENCEIFDWIVLTSPTAVGMFFDKLQEKSIDLRKLNKQKFAVVGSGTQKELAKKGIYADLVPSVFDGVHLAKALCEKAVKGEKILLPRAKKGRSEIVDILTNHGLLVNDLAMYDTVLCENIIFNSFKNIDYIFFTSSSTVENFMKSNIDIDLSKITALCIGKQTQETAQNYGMKTFVSKQASIDSLVELACELCGN
ncbi:MAG: uroporphyrinogen-III C-methyltransferase [Clostridia bacterium]